MFLSILLRYIGRGMMFGAAFSLAASTIPDAHGQEVVVTGEGEILKPELCEPEINRGGNYQEGETYLMGKCERSVYPPVIKGEPGARYLEFSTAGEKVDGGNDRVELAYGPYFPFGETTYVGFQMRIPADSAVTNGMFYPLQFWQCAPLSPRAGIRVDRGTSHSINFMTRHDNTGGGSTHRFTMEKDQWHSFVIAINPDPGGDGLFRVWIDGEDQGAWTGAFGSDREDACRGQDGVPEQRHRLKFGIYKSNEPKVFKTHFTNMRVGSSYEEVVPPAGLASAK